VSRFDREVRFIRTPEQTFVEGRKIGGVWEKLGSTEPGLSHEKRVEAEGMILGALSGLGFIITKTEAHEVQHPSDLETRH
jgi:hypothetical protein